MQTSTSNEVTARWDAADAGCSRLIIGVRCEIDKLAPGQLLEVNASNPSAKLDLWVWCRMTGHSLEVEAHPTYIIRTQGDCHEQQ